ncbi:MAG TPA: hypothetical protein VMT95_01825 [Candidatus Binatia bacterium]|nr:hypothetical protein [Candidatus Binatia bacterium]
MKHRRFSRALQTAIIAVFATSFAACAGPGNSPVAGSQVFSTQPRIGGQRHTAGLGPVVTSQFGGQIFGWDIDQNGNDGVLSETVLGSQVINAIETFDESTGKITKVVQKVQRPNANVEPVVDAIAGSDVGIVDVARQIPQFERNDYFDLINPVTGEKITGRSKPRQILGDVPNFFTNNQASSSQVMMALYPNKKGEDAVGLYTYDTVRNAWGKRVDFPRTFLFQTGFPNYAAVDATTDEAVVGYLGRPRYNPHESATIYIMDAATGKHLRSFYGVGYGWPHGMAIDPTTDTMCTTTTGDMDVEFYNLATGKGKAVMIPIFYSKGPLTNGAAVAADPIHHLFLVAQLNSTFAPNGSTVIVYDEHGKLVEFINGFEFLNRFSVVVPHLAVNPSNRTGYVNGPNLNQLQEFTY